MTHNILVVDDEPKLCDLLASALGQNEVQVLTARCLKTKKPHCASAVKSATR